MAREKAPAFQFYPKDFLSDERVLAMTHTERGIYITFLCVCWLEGSLPADVKGLARVAGIPPGRFERVWAGPLSRCFQPSDEGRLTQKRLELERAKQADYRAIQAENGRKGGRPKVNPDESDGLANVKPKKALLSSSSISNLQKEQKKDRALRACPHEPPCSATTTAHECHKRTILEDGRKARAS